MAGKRYLLTPGPTPVPPEVLAALAEPVIHHRARDYREIYERCLARLRDVYRTQDDVLMFTTSGTGAFESAVANLTSPGDRQLVLSAGNFGERWAGMAKAFGADLVHARLEWGETPEPDDLRSALAGAGEVKVVYLTHSETSTGVVCDVQALAAVAKEAGALVSLTRSPVSAPFRSSRISGESTSSCRARRRRSCAHPVSPSHPFLQPRSQPRRTPPLRVTSWIGSEHVRGRRSSTHRSLRPSPSSARSMSLSASCSPKDSKRRSIGTRGSGGHAARARRRWVWSCSPRTKSAR